MFRRWAPHLLIAAAVFAAYHNSFSVPFVFDDRYFIVDNPAIRAPFSESLRSGTARPVLFATFALNFAAGGLDPRGYHAVNLAIHLAAALALLGILRRTLKRPAVALAAAVLWAVHPLQTESVTYVMQRAESLAGLLCLLTLYAVIRDEESPAQFWKTAAFSFCALAIGTKPSAAAVPLLALLYDRTFLAGTFRGALAKRGRLYAGMAACWLLLAWLIATAPFERSTTGTSAGISPLRYALTQCGVILHYLRLSFWPRPLVLDYRWPAAGAEAIPSALAVAGMLAATVWGIVRRKPAAYIGAWFFGTLAVTSSFMPVNDFAAERRMYLPLAAVAASAALAAGRLRPALFAAAALSAALGLAGATVLRNHDYRSAVAIWEDTARKQPLSARAWNNLGLALARAGHPELARAPFERAAQLDPRGGEALNNLGALAAKRGDLPEAVAYYKRALAANPRHADAHYNLGLALLERGDAAGARRHLEEALRIRPGHRDARELLSGMRE